MQTNTNTGYDYNRNCYDIIRFLATVQVIIGHINMHLPAISLPKYILRFIEMIPGVPVFFVLCGYFTCQSLTKCRNKEFIIKRIIRLYPMLILIQILDAIVIYLSTGQGVSLIEMVQIIGYQLVLGNAHTPKQWLFLVQEE